MDHGGLSDTQRALARGWFGYGRWDAPFWFVGIEPGGDELAECVRLWKRLGESELLDIAAHHEEHSKDWFSESAGTQSTWCKLIWLLLSYHGEEPSRDATRTYQKTRLGRIADETALLEISCIPAKHNGIVVPREIFRDERIATIRERMLQHAPRFVVFYSPDSRYRVAWSKIAGRELSRDQPQLIGRTVCVVTYHPNGKWDKAYRRDMGAKMRGLVDDAAAFAKL